MLRLFRTFLHFDLSEVQPWPDSEMEEDMKAANVQSALDYTIRFCFPDRGPRSSRRFCLKRRIAIIQ
jgi:hypothetical protein